VLNVLKKQKKKLKKPKNGDIPELGLDDRKDSSDDDADTDDVDWKDACCSLRTTTTHAYFGTLVLLSVGIFRWFVPFNQLINVSLFRLDQSHW
jgi:hypothetical protein